ncbi:MAG: hypothetical protein ACLFUS_16735, partial [Candidatus Sumerlaeia bacterium]
KGFRQRTAGILPAKGLPATYRRHLAGKRASGKITNKTEQSLLARIPPHATRMVAIRRTFGGE